MYCKRTPEKISVEWWEYMMSLRDLLVRKVNIQGYTIWYFTLCLLKIVFLRKLGWHLMVQELIKPLVSKWFHFPDRIGEWKIGDRGESLWEQRRELTANLTHIIMVSTLGLKPRSHNFYVGGECSQNCAFNLWPLLPELLSLSVVMFAFKTELLKELLPELIHLNICFLGFTGIHRRTWQARSSRKTSKYRVYSNKRPKSN